MKRSAAILGLLALLALVPCTGLAQTPPPAAPPADLAEFLATLSGSQSVTPATQSATLNFQLITCTDHDDCPQGQLCCYPCGIDGCDFVCMDPDRRGRCPIIP